MLQVCLNGSRRPHERVPVTVTNIAAAAAEAVAGGAESVHVHPRSDRGRETLDGDLVALTVEAVRRAVPGIPVGVTTREDTAPGPQSGSSRRSARSRPRSSSTARRPGPGPSCGGLRNMATTRGSGWRTRSSTRPGSGRAAMPPWSERRSPGEPRTDGGLRRHRLARAAFMGDVPLAVLRPVGDERHRAATARLLDDLAALPPDAPVRLGKRTSNLFRQRTTDSTRLDV